MRTTTNWLIASTVAALLLAGNAWAQPAEEEEEETTTPERSDEDTEDRTAVDEKPPPPDPTPPPPDPTPTPPKDTGQEMERKAAPAQAAPAKAAAAPSSPQITIASLDRPATFSIGIGIGYVMPADIDQPDAVSVRFRIASGLVFEPLVELETGRAKDDDGTLETTDAVNTVRLVTAVRYPLISRGSFDFVITGAVGLRRLSQDPDGNDNNTTATAIDLSWGLGIDYWLSPHWALSFNAANPLIAYASTVQETFTGEDRKSSATTVGAIFDPTVSVMLHLFY